MLKIEAWTRADAERSEGEVEEQRWEKIDGDGGPGVSGNAGCDGWRSTMLFMGKLTKFLW